MFIFQNKSNRTICWKGKSNASNFEGVKLECGYRVDLLVEKKLIIEIKSVASLSTIHLAQTLTYLKLGNYKLGLLINFNEVLLKSGIRRVVNKLWFNFRHF